jgi:hypothetical protein
VKALWISLFAWVLAVSCFGQATNVAVVLPKQDLYIGERLIVTYVLPDEAGPVETRLPKSEGLSLAFVDGRPAPDGETKAFVVRVSVLATGGGDLTLPAIDIKGAQQAWRTPSRSIHVVEPVPTNDLRITTELSSTNVYVGQPVLLTVTLSFDVAIERITALDIRVPLLESKHLEVRDSLKNPRPGAPESIGLPVSDARVVAWTRKEQIVFHKVLIPRKAGTLNIAPAYLLCSLKPGENDARRRGFQYPSYFDNQFFHKETEGAYTRVYHRAAPVKLNVQSLPASPPPGFSGIFGVFSLELEASPTEVQVGDPITLTLRVKDHAFPESVELPPLLNLPGFRGLFDIPEERAPGRVENGVRIFRQTLRPIREGVRSIPPIQLSYFDLDSAAFGTVRAEAVPLTVRPGRMAGAGDAVLSDGTRLRNTIKPLKDGITHNFSIDQVLHPPAITLNPLRAWLAALLMPPLLFGLFNWVTRDQQLALRDPDAARRRCAAKNFHHRLHGAAAGDFSVLRAALQTYLSDHFSLNRRRPVLADVEDRINDDQVRKDLHAIFATSESALFSDNGSGADWQSLKALADKSVETLERGGRS